MRALILGAEPKLAEHLKWNAPSYVLDGEDRITFNLLNKEGMVKIVLHMGATRKENKKGEPVLRDATGLIAWSSDIRGVLSFGDLADITSKQDAVAQIIKDWLKIDTK